MDTKQAGRLGGLSKSKEKIKASIQNGKKGGRPRKEVRNIAAPKVRI